MTIIKNKALILLVDNDLKNIQIIGNLLIEKGYNILVSTSEYQTISMIKNNKPDLILIDIMISDKSAYDLCSEIKNDITINNIPIIFLAEKYETKDILKGFLVGAVDFIIKPFHKEEVLARIDNQVELKISRDLINKQNDEIKATNEKLNQELRIASDYFCSLLPEKISNQYLQTFWKYEPTEQLGGDAFGYFNIDEDNFIIYLFDVSGHGIASGMYSVSLINTLKYQNLSSADFKKPESVFRALNKLYQINEHNGMYFTIWYGVYNLKTRILNFASAGHHPVIISYSNGTTEYLSSQNFIIGGLKEYEFVSKEIFIDSKSDLYVFSDGTFNLKKPDGTIWTIDDIKQFIEARHSRNDKELIQLYNFVSSLYEFSHHKDDFTILKIRFK